MSSYLKIYVKAVAVECMHLAIKMFVAVQKQNHVQEGIVKLLECPYSPPLKIIL